MHPIYFLHLLLKLHSLLSDVPYGLLGAGHLTVFFCVGTRPTASAQSSMFSVTPEKLGSFGEITPPPTRTPSLSQPWGNQEMKPCCTLRRSGQSVRLLPRAEGVRQPPLSGGEGRGQGLNLYMCTGGASKEAAAVSCWFPVTQPKGVQPKGVQPKGFNRKGFNQKGFNQKGFN